MTTAIKSSPATLRGIATVRLQAADHASAKSWYTKLLGVAPYFDRPGYCEFRVGDYEHELGLLDTAFACQLGGQGGGISGPAGIVAYWHVDDVESAFERMVSLGAAPNEPIRDFGHGFIGASVIDPFGNILGIMQNPHYLAVLGGVREG